MKGYTIEEVLSWDVCYSRKELEELFAGRETLTALDCFCLDIPAQDKLFVLLRPEVIPKKELHLLACDFAERVAHLTRDPRSAEAIRVKRLWLDGKATDEELAAARAAAKAAARAANAAAEAAAAEAAAAGVERCSAVRAERKAQLDLVREVIERLDFNEGA